MQEEKEDDRNEHENYESPLTKANKHMPNTELCCKLPMK